MACNTITIGATMLATLTGLYDNSSATYQNSATVTGQLYESDRTTVVGSSFSMSYVAASNGNYQGTLAAAVTTTLTEGTEYLLLATAVVGSVTLPVWQSVTAVY